MGCGIGYAEDGDDVEVGELVGGQGGGDGVVPGFGGASDAVEDGDLAAAVAVALQKIDCGGGGGAVAGVDDEALAGVEMADDGLGGAVDEGDEGGVGAGPAEAGAGEGKGGELREDLVLGGVEAAGDEGADAMKHGIAAGQDTDFSVASVVGEEVIYTLRDLGLPDVSGR
jgi:hypothetical protein